MLTESRQIILKVTCFLRIPMPSPALRNRWPAAATAATDFICCNAAGHSNDDDYPTRSPTQDSAPMKFFVPTAANTIEAEQLYQSIRCFVTAQVGPLRKKRI